MISELVREPTTFSLAYKLMDILSCELLMFISVHAGIKSVLKLEWRLQILYLSSDNLLQLSTILWLKKYFLVSLSRSLLYNFKLCPLKSVVLAIFITCIIMVVKVIDYLKKGFEAEVFTGWMPLLSPN